MTHLKASGRRGIARVGAALVWPGLLCIIPALLFLPALYYSLDTPFNLVDDYDDQRNIAIYDNFASFFSELKRQFAGPDLHRFRPLFYFYGGATWKVFGDLAWLHHLSRWVWHFAALFVFAAALLRFAGRQPPGRAAAVPAPGVREGGGIGRRMAGRLAAALPLAFLLYIWFFFPNSPAARLPTVEVSTVFFLGLCTWMAALALTAAPGRLSPRQSLLLYGVFALGYAGLVLAKEVNIGVAGWLLLAYLGYARYADRAGRASGGKLLLGAVPLLLLFFLSVSRIGAAAGRSGAGYGTGLDETTIQANLSEIAAGLFQTETSLLITAVFALLAAALLLSLAIQAVKRQWNSETAFGLLLLGQFAAMLLLLGMSWGVSLRYWYILLPVFAMLLALGVKHLLRWCAAGGPGLRCAIVAGLGAFLVFFVAANYYNFLWQTLIQHSSRHADAQFLARATGLLQGGEYVQIHATGDLNRIIRLYYAEYLPRFRGEEYAIHREPPDDAARPYYLAALERHPLPLPAHTAIAHSDDYAGLSPPRRVAGWLQGGAPHRSQDLGVYAPGEYRWNIYRLPYNLDAYAARLPQEYGAPAAQGGGWLVYRLDDWIAYVKAPCGDADIAEPFFLHFIAQSADDLPAANRELGFAGRDFHFTAPYDFRTEATCIAVRRLPEYPVSRLRTGQYIPEGNQEGEQLWRVEFPADTPPGR